MAHPYSHGGDLAAFMPQAQVCGALSPARGFDTESPEGADSDFFEFVHVRRNVPFGGAKGKHRIAYDLAGPVIGDPSAPNGAGQGYPLRFQPLNRDEKIPRVFAQPVLEPQGNGSGMGKKQKKIRHVSGKSKLSGCGHEPIRILHIG
jgi:hypothetical protein